MKICAVSDLHGRLPAIPACDVLVIAGDITPDYWSLHSADLMRARQVEWLQTEYAAWEHTVPAKHILATPGNHDWWTRLPDGLRTRLFIDEGCEVWDEATGLLRTFWFTPWIEPVAYWNFMLPRAERKAYFGKIPTGLDVLVAHSPAHGVRDTAYDGEHCGCPELRHYIQERKPKFFFYGHIHEAQRLGGPHSHLGETQTYCCSMWGDNWTPVEVELR